MNANNANNGERRSLSHQFQQISNLSARARRGRGENMGVLLQIEANDAAAEVNAT